MRDVTEWLRSLGLERYAAQFAAQEIDLATLPLLTDAHLTQLGLPIGPRARVLAAIESMRAQPATVADIRESSVAGPPDDAPVIDSIEGERRRITILFADLADSTSLAARLDPEDLRALMQQYQLACAQVIDRYGGHVAQYMGDGIMAYFGWPSAQEDSAERAVRAGLDLVAAVKALRSAETLTVRVGINTGTVVISDTGHGDPSIPQAAAGVTPHIAARLQSLAAPNSVLISDSTSRLVGAACEQEALGPQVLKGVADAVPVYRVTQMHTRRFAANRTRALTPFVGRQAELGLLQQRWRDAQDGEGQVVYVSGVPGIGKSRIVHELEQRIAGAVQFRLRFQCTPHDAQSALRPIIRGLAWAADMDDDDAPDVKLAKIRRLLELSADHVEAALPLWADLFAVPLPANVARHPASAQQQKDQTLFLLADVLAGLSRRGNVFCLLEDAQWIDPSTQQLLTLIPPRIEHASVLFVVTHRPEYQPQLGERGNTSTLAIARLGRRDMVEMATAALQARASEQGLVQRILDAAEAIPLFVEELARGAIESPHGAQPPAAGAAREVGESSVPSALRDALVARLDRAPQGRHIAQIAAVIGREFPITLLRRVTSLPESELEATLSYLVRSQILLQMEREPVARYGFTHALLRDVAYESLLRSTRRELHLRVAAALEQESPELQTTQPELLAYHRSEAGDVPAAVSHWLAGAKLARARWSHREAIAQLQSALRLLGTQPASAQRDARELEATLLFGLSLIAIEGYSSPAARDAFERARTLGAAHGDPQRNLQALFGLWGHYWMAARHDRAIELARELAAQGASLGQPESIAIGQRALGSTLFTLGAFIPARDHLLEAMRILGTDAAPAASYAVDPRIAAQLLLGWNDWFLGFADRALGNVEAALARAQASHDPYSMAFAHYVNSAVHLLRGNAQAALDHAERSHAIATEHRISLYALYSQFGRGCARALLARQNRGEGRRENSNAADPVHGTVDALAHPAPDVAGALADIQAGIDAARASELGYMRAFMFGWLARTHLDRGESQQAARALDEASKHVDDIAGRAWEAEVLRLRGDLMLAADGTTPARIDDAARCYTESLAVARTQQAHALELRAGMSLARLHANQGNAAAARAVLAPLVAWFGEGAATSDLRDAHALLKALR